VLQKEDSDWVKKCMEYEMEGARPGVRPKKTWRLWKKTVRHVNWTLSMPWIIVKPYNGCVLVWRLAERWATLY